MSLSGITKATNRFIPKRVDRVTGDIAQGGFQNLFTITGGLVWITNTQGHITTAIEAAGNNTYLDFLDASTAVATALCTVLDTTNDLIGGVYTLSGNVGAALALAPAGTVSPSFTWNAGLILDAGLVRLNCAGTNDGQIQWSVWYIPVDGGAVIVAA